MKKRTMRRLELVLHMITVLILLLKALDLLKQHLYFPAFIILMAAVSALAVITFKRQMRIRSKYAGIICFYIEAPALLVIAYALHLEGKPMLPYIFFTAGLMYPVAGFIATKKFRQIKKPPLKRRL